MNTVDVFLWEPSDSPVPFDPRIWERGMVQRNLNYRPSDRLLSGEITIPNMIRSTQEGISLQCNLFFSPIGFVYLIS